MKTEEAGFANVLFKRSGKAIVGDMVQFKVGFDDPQGVVTLGSVVGIFGHKLEVDTGAGVKNIDRCDVWLLNEHPSHDDSAKAQRVADHFALAASQDWKDFL